MPPQPPAPHRRTVPCAPLQKLNFSTQRMGPIAPRSARCEPPPGVPDWSQFGCCPCGAVLRAGFAEGALVRAWRVAVEGVLPGTRDWVRGVREARDCERRARDDAI